jgi:hypothetical protein
MEHGANFVELRTGENALSTQFQILADFPVPPASVVALLFLPGKLGLKLTHAGGGVMVHDLGGFRSRGRLPLQALDVGFKFAHAGTLADKLGSGCLKLGRKLAHLGLMNATLVTIHLQIKPCAQKIRRQPLGFIDAIGISTRRKSSTIPCIRP